MRSIEFEVPSPLEMCHRPLSAGLAQKVCERAMVSVEPIQEPMSVHESAVTLIRQFGRYQEPETGVVWTHGEVQKGLAAKTVHVINADLA